MPTSARRDGGVQPSEGRETANTTTTNTNTNTKSNGDGNKNGRSRGGRFQLFNPSRRSTSGNIISTSSSSRSSVTRRRGSDDVGTITAVAADAADSGAAGVVGDHRSVNHGTWHWKQPNLIQQRSSTERDGVAGKQPQRKQLTAEGMEALFSDDSEGSPSGSWLSAASSLTRPIAGRRGKPKTKQTGGSQHGSAVSMTEAATDTAAILESYMPASLPARRRPATLIRRSSMPPPSSRSAGDGEVGRAAAVGTQNSGGSKTAGGDKGTNGNNQTMTTGFKKALPVSSQSHHAFASTGSGNLGPGVAPRGEDEGDSRPDVDGRDFDRLVGKRGNCRTDGSRGGGGDNDGGSRRPGNRSGQRSTVSRSAEAMITPSVRVSLEATRVSSQSTTTSKSRTERLEVMAESGGGNAANVSTSGKDSSISKYPLRAALPATARLTAATPAIKDGTGITSTVPESATANSKSTTRGFQANDGQTSCNQPSRAAAASCDPNRDNTGGGCIIQRAVSPDTRNVGHQTPIPSYERHKGGGRTDGSRPYRDSNNGSMKDHGDEWDTYGYLSDLDGGARSLVQSEALTAVDFKSQALPISPSEVQPSTNRQTSGPYRGVVTGDTKGDIHKESAVGNKRQGRMVRPVSGVMLPKATARRFASGRDQQVQPPRPKSWSYQKATSLVTDWPAEDTRNSTVTDIGGIAGTARVVTRGGSSSRLDSRSSSNSKLSRIDSLLDMTQVAGEVRRSRPSSMQCKHMSGFGADASLEDVGTVKGEDRDRDDVMAAARGSEEELENDFNSDEGEDDQIYHTRHEGAMFDAEDVDEAFDRTFGQTAHAQILPSKNTPIEGFMGQAAATSEEEERDEEQAEEFRANERGNQYHHNFDSRAVGKGQSDDNNKNHSDSWCRDRSDKASSSRREAIASTAIKAPTPPIPARQRKGRGKFRVRRKTEKATTSGAASSAGSTISAKEQAKRDKDRIAGRTGSRFRLGGFGFGGGGSRATDTSGASSWGLSDGFSGTDVGTGPEETGTRSRKSRGNTSSSRGSLTATSTDGRNTGGDDLPSGTSDWSDGEEESVSSQASLASSDFLSSRSSEGARKIDEGGVDRLAAAETHRGRESDDRTSPLRSTEYPPPSPSGSDEEGDDIRAPDETVKMSKSARGTHSSATTPPGRKSSTGLRHSILWGDFVVPVKQVPSKDPGNNPSARDTDLPKSQQAVEPPYLDPQASNSTEVTHEAHHETRAARMNSEKSGAPRGHASTRETQLEDGNTQHQIPLDARHDTLAGNAAPPSPSSPAHTTGAGATINASDVDGVSKADQSDPQSEFEKRQEVFGGGSRGKSDSGASRSGGSGRAVGSRGGGASTEEEPPTHHPPRLVYDRTRLNQRGTQRRIQRGGSMPDMSSEGIAKMRASQGNDLQLDGDRRPMGEENAKVVESCAGALGAASRKWELPAAEQPPNKATLARFTEVSGDGSATGETPWPSNKRMSPSASSHNQDWDEVASQCSKSNSVVSKGSSYRRLSPAGFAYKPGHHVLDIEEQERRELEKLHGRVQEETLYQKKLRQRKAEQRQQQQGGSSGKSSRHTPGSTSITTSTRAHQKIRPPLVVPPLPRVLHGVLPNDTSSRSSIASTSGANMLSLTTAEDGRPHLTIAKPPLASRPSKNTSTSRRRVYDDSCAPRSSVNDHETNSAESGSSAKGLSAGVGQAREKLKRSSASERYTKNQEVVAYNHGGLRHERSSVRGASTAKAGEINKRSMSLSSTFFATKLNMAAADGSHRASTVNLAANSSNKRTGVARVCAALSLPWIGRRSNSQQRHHGMPKKNERPGASVKRVGNDPEKPITIPTARGRGSPSDYVVARQFLANAARKESTTAMPPGYKHRTATIAPSPSEGLFYTSLSAANPRRGGTSGEFFDFASTPPDQSASSSNKTGEMIDYHSWVNPQRREGGVGAEVASRGAGLHWLNPMSQSGGRSSGGDEDGIHRRMGPDSLLGAPIIDVTTSERTPMGVATFDDEEEEAKKRMETLLLRSQVHTHQRSVASRLADVHEKGAVAASAVQQADQLQATEVSRRGERTVGSRAARAGGRWASSKPWHGAR